ncbi:MAG TPA: hypothetical protein VHB21_04755, partial [Minicystis sp.]|nr:hypothetical protein [Minicystis sp.]
MRELGERGRAVVSHARVALQPTMADRQRVRAALAARLAPAPGPAAPPHGAASALAPLRRVSLGVKLGAGLAVVAIAAASLLPVPSAQHTAPSAPRSADDGAAAQTPV